jgi:hypothetical protein
VPARDQKRPLRGRGRLENLPHALAGSTKFAHAAQKMTVCYADLPLGRNQPLRGARVNDPHSTITLARPAQNWRMEKDGGKKSAKPDV